MKHLNTFIAITALLYSSSNHAAFILEGEHEIYNFNSSSFAQDLTSGSNRAQLQLTFANSFETGGLDNPYLYNGHLEPGESMRVDLYENQNDTDPFATHIIDGQDPESYAQIFFWQDFSGTGTELIPWLDREGSIIITSITGEFELLQPSITIINDGYEYTGEASISSVPLPPSFLLLLSSVLTLGLFRKKPNEKTGTENNPV